MKNKILDLFLLLFIEKEKLKCHIDISIQTLCYDTWNLAQVPPISLDHVWDVYTPWLESICGKWWTPIKASPQWKTHESPLGVSKKAPKGLPQTVRNKILWSDETMI